MKPARKQGKKESDIQKEIMDYLKVCGHLAFKHRNVGIYKQATGRYIPLSFGEKGISDIIGCTRDGRFFAIEVKKPKGQPTQEQLDFLAAVNERGGFGILAYSLDDVMGIELKKPKGKSTVC